MPDTSPPAILGDWDVTIATPIGKMAVSMTFRQSP